MDIPKDILKKLKLREEPKLDAAAQAFVDQIEYKEVLNKEIAEAREYTNVDKYTGVDAHQLLKMDKGHIIEVLVHAMGTIRFLRDWDADTLGPDGKVSL
jgi:hypothetical protein